MKYELEQCKCDGIHYAWLFWLNLKLESFSLISFLKIAFLINGMLAKYFRITLVNSPHYSLDR